MNRPRSKSELVLARESAISAANSSRPIWSKFWLVLIVSAIKVKCLRVTAFLSLVCVSTPYRTKSPSSTLDRVTNVTPYWVDGIGADLYSSPMTSRTTTEIYACGCIVQKAGVSHRHVYCGETYCHASQAAGMMKGGHDARATLNSAARHVGRKLT